MAKISLNLRQHLKKLAHKTSVDRLVKSGVKEVQVLGLDHVVSLVEQAVHRTLRSKLMGLERDELAGATKEEFVRLLQSHQHLQRTHDEVVREKERAEEEVDQLRRELNQQQHALSEKLEVAEQELRAQYAGEDIEILAKVDHVLAQLAATPGTDPTRMRERILELVMDIVGNERQAALHATQVAHDREVDLLERRISKLNASLQETEGRLANISSVKSVDPGISSIYREVQGLRKTDDLFERKRELMSDIFTANLALQKGAG